MKRRLLKMEMDRKVEMERRQMGDARKQGEKGGKTRPRPARPIRSSIRASLMQFVGGAAEVRTVRKLGRGDEWGVSSATLTLRLCVCVCRSV